MTYRDDITGLRAIAVLAVVVNHVNPTVLPSGYLGVDIFFVISGYLITNIIAEQVSLGRFSLTEFYLRRTRRLLPALYPVLLFSLFLGLVFLNPLETVELAGSTLSGALFSANIFFLHHSDYFDTDAMFKPLLHLWSLGVEEQFYLIFPFLFVLLSRAGSRVILDTLLLVFLIASLTLYFLYFDDFSSEVFYLPWFRFWEFMVGALCAFAPVKPFRVRSIVSGLCTAALIMPLFLLLEDGALRASNRVLVVLATAAVILLGSKGFVGLFYTNRAAHFIGKISYSLYLWHWPILVFARVGRGYVSSPVQDMFLMLLAGCLSFFSWRYVEQPFRGSSEAFSDRRFFIGSFAMVSSLIVFFVGSELTEGYKFRFAKHLDGDLGHHVFHETLDKEFVDCGPSEIRDSALVWDGFLRCKQSMESSIPEVIILGDSHAEHLYFGIARGLRSYNVAFYIRDGIPVHDVSFADAGKFSGILNYLSALPKTAIILISFSHSRTNYLMVNSPDKIPRVKAGLAKTISLMRKSGHEVLLVGDVPTVADPAQCTDAWDIRELPGGCVQSRAFEEDVVLRDHHALLDSVAARTSTPMISLMPLFCSESDCFIGRGNQIFYRDRDHLNLNGSSFAGEYIIKYLSEKKYLVP